MFHLRVCFLISVSERSVLSSGVVVFEMVIAFCIQLLSQSGARAAKASHTHRLQTFQGAVRCKISDQSGTGLTSKEKKKRVQEILILFLGRLLKNFYASLNNVTFFWEPDRCLGWLILLIDIGIWQIKDVLSNNVPKKKKKTCLG